MYRDYLDPEVMANWHKYLNPQRSAQSGGAIRGKQPNVRNSSTSKRKPELTLSVGIAPHIWLHLDTVVESQDLQLLDKYYGGVACQDSELR